MPSHQPFLPTTFGREKYWKKKRRVLRNVCVIRATNLFPPLSIRLQPTSDQLRVILACYYCRNWWLRIIVSYWTIIIQDKYLSHPSSLSTNPTGLDWSWYNQNILLNLTSIVNRWSRIVCHQHFDANFVRVQLINPGRTSRITMQKQCQSTALSKRKQVKMISFNFL